MHYQDWMILVTAATPLIELRGSIPLGLTLGIPIERVFIFSVIGNILPIPFILIGISLIMQYLRLIPKLHAWVEQKGIRGSSKLNNHFQKWGWLALLIFVAIPLPGTGAWTGALAASLLRLKFWPSFISIALGVICAGLLVSSLSIGVITLVK